MTEIDSPHDDPYIAIFYKDRLYTNNININANWIKRANSIPRPDDNQACIIYHNDDKEYTGGMSIQHGVTARFGELKFIRTSEIHKYAEYMI